MKQVTALEKALLDIGTDLFYKHVQKQIANKELQHYLMSFQLIEAGKVSYGYTYTFYNKDGDVLSIYRDGHEPKTETVMGLEYDGQQGEIHRCLWTFATENQLEGIK